MRGTQSHAQNSFDTALAGRIQETSARVINTQFQLGERRTYSRFKRFNAFRAFPGLLLAFLNRP